MDGSMNIESRHQNIRLYVPLVGTDPFRDPRRLSHKGKTNFHKCSAIDPNNLGNDFSPVAHLPLSPDADARVENKAEQQSNDPNQPNYDALGNNCISYANDLYYYGVGAQLRSNMGN
jgi:hypothetical protein